MTKLTCRCRGHLFLVLLPLVASCAASDGDIAVSRESPSPDGRFKAVLYTNMGGGAAGWCEQAVRVLPANITFDTQAPRRTDVPKRVFSVSCSSKVDLEWPTNDHLAITYTVDSIGVSVWQQARSEDSPVTVSFAAR